MKSLPVTPFSPAADRTIEISVPGSKSITNRAMILAALRAGTTRLSNALFSEDTRAMIACLQKLGFKIDADETARTIRICGCGGKIPAPSAELFVATAGTAARFLTAFLALAPQGSYRLDGSEVMRRRPMKGLLDALEKLGCRFTFHGEAGFFPFTMTTGGVPAGTAIAVDASASSQILSALMMIAPMRALKISLTGTTVSKPFLEMTTTMIGQFGGKIAGSAGGYVSDGGGYASGDFDYAIEPDATAASYFAVRAIAGGRIFVRGLCRESIQGDTRFFDLLEQHDFVRREISAAGTLFLPGKSLKGASLALDFNAISDTFLSLAAFVPVTGARVTINGIAHTRLQESDRVHAMATELAKIVGAQNIVETEDSLTIAAPQDLAGTLAKATLPIAVDTYCDHRIAMSFGMLGSVDLLGNARPWLVVNDPGCCAKTFPDFFEVLAKMGAR